MARKGKEKKLTPMMQQYMKVKDQYPNGVVFFRMGDFFEMFFDDAKLASRVLDIALTHRNKMKDEPIPMAGIPHHSYRNYVNRMVAAGHTVVICDQVEDAKLAKGLVKRDVTRIVTPGMVLDPDALDSHSNHYLMGIINKKKRWGLSMLDLTTGDFRLTEVSEEEVLSETYRISPSELLLSEDQRDIPLIRDHLSRLEGVAIKFREPRCFANKETHERLCEHFEVHSLDGFGVEKMQLGTRAAGALLDYVFETQKKDPPHISRLIPYALHDHMVIDEVTCTNLELLESSRARTRKGSLFGLLDRAVTPMGSRKIRSWLMYPLLEPSRIQRRLDAVELFTERSMLRDSLREALKKIYDLERLNGKVASGLATPRDMYTLRTSLAAVPEVSQLLAELGEDGEQLHILRELDPVEEVVEDIQKVLIEDPPALLKDGGVIREGFDEELDECRYIASNNKDMILEMEAREREDTSINSLKIKFNRVFGYFIEVSKPNIHLVPTDRYQRKQTMANHERYITTELDEFGTKVLQAEEKSLELEQTLFTELRERVSLFGPRIASLADRIAQLDALVTFAELAVRYDYCKPELFEESIIDIEQGRHPVVEQMMQAGEFVPNDLKMYLDKGQFVLLTGPNMSGKSTIMRQIALISLMSQIGSFVPARKAQLGICDRIFTRVGASDNLAGGQSTFMVEMTETSNILHNATSRSLVILDEIGRGTSTFDGISIAWAVAEFLHNRISCRTLFATHYHELTELEACLETFRNMSISIQEWNEEIHFLHTLVEGGTNHSYGIQVGRLAGLPRSVVKRAQQILTGLEQGKLPSSADIGGLHASKDNSQLSLFAPAATNNVMSSFLEDELERLDINSLSPMEALQTLFDWKKRMKEEQ